MPYDQNKYNKEYYQRNKEKLRTRGRIHYSKHRDKIRTYSAVYSKSNVTRNSLYRRRNRYRVIKSIFDLLGYECSLCGEKDKYVLQIDHINGGGNRHAKSTHCSLARYYKVILESIKNKEGEYRTLCANCNIREGVRKKFRSSVWNFNESYFKELLKDEN